MTTKDIIRSILISGGFLVGAVIVVLWALYNTPFIRYKETVLYSSLFFLGTGVVMGFVIALIIGGLLEIKATGVKFND
jgi:hypothetical protein